MFGKIVGTIIGGAIALASGYGIWRLIEMILSGVAEEHWLKVIAGGILAYLFIGILATICLVGLAIMVLVWVD